eukprot:TRINITY_DN67248_c0_g1_i1.p1 TRINITY_DN67248_c0_g1~~TRINITY_DN67248_c0_g1_i1.p1  ORF type:complete len:432 (-),score=54.64 TRINITY_DN67248_c0_g1_i1:148-1443(-)
MARGGDDGNRGRCFQDASRSCGVGAIGLGGGGANGRRSDRQSVLGVAVFVAAQCWTISCRAAAVVAPQEQVISMRPLVIVVTNFATVEECHHVLGLIERCHRREWSDCHEQKSSLHQTNASGTRNISAQRGLATWRHSTSFTLGLSGEVQDTVIDGLVRRSHLLARHPITHGEGVQIASYAPGDYYEFHHDGLRRRATALVYLEDVAEGDGGETIFPMIRADGVSPDTPPPLPPAVVGYDRGTLGFKVESFRDMAPYCNSDYYLKVRPEAGKALLFFSYGPDSISEVRAIHGACPVRSGRKAIFQRWMRFDPNNLYNSSDDAAVRQERFFLDSSRHLAPELVPAPPPTPPWWSEKKTAAATNADESILEQTKVPPPTPRLDSTNDTLRKERLHLLMRRLDSSTPVQTQATQVTKESEAGTVASDVSTPPEL